MRVLYLQPGAGVGGSKISLFGMLRHTPQGQTSQVALAPPPDSEYQTKISDFVEKIHYLDLPTWNSYHRSGLLQWIKTPFSHAWRLIGLLAAAAHLVRIIDREHIDLVHTNNAICPAGAMAAAASRIAHVWHIREPVGSRGQYPLILGDSLSAHLFRVLSQAILCNSEYTAEFFRAHLINVQVVPNSLDVVAFQGDDARMRGRDLRSRLVSPEASTVVGMAGNLSTSWKAHGVFLEVAALILASYPKCRFVVFGGTTDFETNQHTREIRSIVHRLGLEPAVTFAEFVADIPAMMNSIDILVHPASTEGSGRVIMEAMASGTPVVAFEAGGVRELVRDGVTGYLVATGDVHSLAAKVEVLLVHAQARVRMGKRAAAAARRFDSTSAGAAALLQVYENAMRAKVGIHAVV